mmetsp:Transcript_49268/g.96380  ORF Transcript_49268/g.96380 Transcript_49268/m.96380 type:complete len:199 (-) Transcript_49268:163-759(-)|eukprot:CAMPEP_0194324402 /NCGR_PEP_ID=MMETSP0171-20130528/27770_1 /TAXON_ID=218684 /ORGANISM="Corethron pennatum, Strain L29A3" /LENGTH=198 /DNA_ID=CAMNT_0039083293 /DNA_START=80 /DNA_END=676 /DNA_ORIENTATION=-
MATLARPSEETQDQHSLPPPPPSYYNVSRTPDMYSSLPVAQATLLQKNDSYPEPSAPPSVAGVAVGYPVASQPEFSHSLPEYNEVFQVDPDKNMTGSNNQRIRFSEKEDKEKEALGLARGRRLAAADANKIKFANYIAQKRDAEGLEMYSPSPFPQTNYDKKEAEFNHVPEPEKTPGYDVTEYNCTDYETTDYKSIYD